MALFDMHCHLDFAGNGAELARTAARRGVGAFSNTVTPDGYLRFLEGLRRDGTLPDPARAGVDGGPADATAPAGSDGAPPAGTPPLRVGLGLHPWWVADGTCTDEDVALFEELAPGTAYIGEVGLDFAPRRDGTQGRQLAAFVRVAAACAGGGKVLSVHAVRAATAVLDVLERTGCLREGENAVVLHWFSGSSDELTRAARLGCYFSVGTRMLATKRGRAYARAIPAGRLLLETDLPDNPVEGFDPAAWLADLARARDLLVETTGRPDLAETVAQTSRSLLRG